MNSSSKGNSSRSKPTFPRQIFDTISQPISKYVLTLYQFVAHPREFVATLNSAHVTTSNPHVAPTKFILSTVSLIAICLFFLGAGDEQHSFITESVRANFFWPVVD